MTVTATALPFAARQRRVVGLVVAGVGCFMTAGLLTSSAVDALHETSGAAAVRAGGTGPPATARELAWVVTLVCVAVICAVVTETTRRPRPGASAGAEVEPAPLGLLRGVGNSRFIGGALGAVIAYLATVYLLVGVAPQLITTGQWPELPTGPADPGALGGDLLEAGAAGFIEELSLFAIPLALLGLWTGRYARWAGLVLIIATYRVGIGYRSWATATAGTQGRVALGQRCLRQCG